MLNGINVLTILRQSISVWLWCFQSGIFWIFHSVENLAIDNFWPNLGQKKVPKKIIRSWGKKCCFLQVGVIKSKLGLVSEEQGDQRVLLFLSVKPSADFCRFLHIDLNESTQVLCCSTFSLCVAAVLLSIPGSFGAGWALTGYMLFLRQQQPCSNYL